MIKKIFQLILPKVFKLKLKNKLGVPSQQSSLEQLKKLGFTPKYCLDIGAYEGIWTREFKAVFPQCAVLMIEGQAEKEPALNETKKTYPNIDYQIALLGASETLVSFNKYETASSILKESNVTNATVEERKLSLLDKLLPEKNFTPDFIKIDTQGYELEILKGGEQALSSAQVVLLEVSFLDIYTDCPLALNVFNYMDLKGFVIYDICSIMRRPLDNTLYQADILFVRKNSYLRADKRWS